MAERTLTQNTLWLASIFYTALALFAPWTQSHATARQTPLISLPSANGTPELSCGELLGATIEFRQPQIIAFNRQSFSKEQILTYIEYLSSIHFHLTSRSLSIEPITVRNLLTKRFNEPMDGRKLYSEIRRHFPSVNKAIEQTKSGKKLLFQTNPAKDNKAWARPLLIQVARDVEKLGMPFHKEFLDAHSSLVGMLLAEVYGYPIQGDVILRRAHKADLSIADIRKEAGMAEQSPNLEKIHRIQNLEWSKELLIDLLSSLKDHGFEILESEFQKRGTEIASALWRIRGVKVSAGTLLHRITEYGGWVALKKELGYSYEGVRKHVPGHLDWTPELIIKILQFIHSQGHAVHYRFFKNKEAFAPLKAQLEEKFAGYVSGKLLYERSQQIFGSFQEACLQAGVPYTNHTQTRILTDWNSWSENSQKHDVSQLMLIEILNHINSKGYLPTKHLLLDPVAFSPAHEEIKKEFKLEITGNDLYELSLGYFDSHEEALEGIGIYHPSSDLSSEQIEQATAFIYYAFGKLNEEKLKNEYSDQIAELLKEKMNLAISGAALVRAIHRLPITGDRSGRRAVLFKNVIQAEKERLTSDYAENREADLKRLENKELFIQVIQALSSEGIVFNKEITYSRLELKIRNILKKQFDLHLDGSDLKAQAKKVFGGLAEARIAAGYARRSMYSYRTAPKALGSDLDNGVMDLSDNEIKIFLEAIYTEWPDISVNQFSEAKKSQQIKSLLNDRFQVAVTGSTLLKRIKEKFGSLAGATAALKIKKPWNRSRNPTKEELFKVFRMIEDMGYRISPRFLRDFEYRHPELMEALEAEFGFPVRGITVFNYARKLFGQLELAVEAAGLKYDPPSLSEVQPSTKVTYTEAQLKEYLEAIFSEYPNLPFKKFSEAKTSKDIKALLQTKFNVEHTGSSIYNRIVETYGSLRNASETLNLNLPWNRNNPPTKSKLIEVLRFIAQRGYSITPKFLGEFEYNNPELNSQLAAEFGHPIRGISIYKYSRDLFGQVENALKAAGLSYNLPTSADRAALTTLQLSDDQIKTFTEFVFEQRPELLFHQFSYAKPSREIAMLLKQRFDIECTGSILYRRILARFGSLQNAAKELEIKIRWGHNYTPSKEEVIAVLRFIHAKGYKITATFLKTVDAKHPELMNEVAEEFGIRIRGISLYKYPMNRFYKSNGFQRILEEAGIEN